MLDKLRQHPLASANFRRFWLGQLLSIFGTTFSGMAITWLLMSLTDSTLSRGISFTLSMLPNLLFAPLAGSIIDRFSRRLMLIISDLTRIVIDLALVFVLLTGSVTVWHILCLFPITRFSPGFLQPLPHCFRAYSSTSRAITSS